MIRPLLALLLLSPAAILSGQPSTPSDGPTYTASGELKLPENYREWIFLTSGVDMSYTTTETPGHSVFDNVFVNPSAYREFLKTGTWPDKTVLILEIRSARGHGLHQQARSYPVSEDQRHGGPREGRSQRRLDLLRLQ